MKQQKRDFTSETLSVAKDDEKKTQEKNLKSWIVGKRASKKIVEWILKEELRNTVKNNGRKFVGFRAEKIIFFVHSDVHVGNLLSFIKIQRFFFSCIKSEDLWSSASFHKNIKMNKKNWFSQREIHKFSSIIFHSAEKEFSEHQQNYHLAIPGLSSIKKIFFDSFCWSNRAGPDSACQIDAIFGN